MIRTTSASNVTLEISTPFALGRRALHVLDVENLVGAGRLTAEMVAATARLYHQVVPLGLDDLIVCAADINNQFCAA